MTENIQPNLAPDSFRRAPIHESIADDLRRIFENGELGAKIESEPELAKRYGVSIPTLRNAILVLEHEGILKRRQGKGTFIVGRGNVKDHKSVCISLSINMLHYPCACEFHLRQAHEIYRQLSEKGLSPRFVLNEPKLGTGSTELRNFLQSSEARCLIALSEIPEEIEKLAGDRGIVLFGTGKKATKPAILDYREFATLALTEVKRQGGRRVAFIGWGTENGQMESEVFFSVAEQLDLQTKKSWVIGDLNPKDIGSGWSAFREMWIADRERPDSLVISEEALLPGAVQAMNDLNLSTRDGFCLVAHGNSPDLLPVPVHGITRLWYSIEEFGDAYVAATERALAGRTLGDPRIIRPQIERPESEDVSSESVEPPAWAR